MVYKAVINDNYLCHYNKNHSKANGQFVSGDGDGDGEVGEGRSTKKRGVYSAKIENYHKGNLFKDPYYIDKKGNKRSYMSYKEMPVEVQNAEKARAKGKQFAKKALSIGLTTLGSAALVVGTAFVIKKIQKANSRENDY